MASKSKKSETPAEEFVATEVAAEAAPVVEDDGLTETDIVQAPDVTEALVSADDFDYGDAFEGDAVKLKANELVIPMIKIGQLSSQLVKDGKVKFGDIYNTLTGEVYDGQKGLLCVPIHSAPHIVCRETTANGGKFIEKLSCELDVKKGGDPQVIAAYKENGKDGWIRLEGKRDGKKVQYNYVDEVHVVILSQEDGVTPLGVALIPFGGQNLFQRKLWWQAIAEFYVPPGKVAPAVYAFRTLIKTAFQKGGEGKSDTYKFVCEPYVAKNWGLSRIPGKNVDTMHRCKSFLQLLTSGALGKADYTDPDAEGVSESDREAAAFTVDPSGNAPF